VYTITKVAFRRLLRWRECCLPPRLRAWPGDQFFVRDLLIYPVKATFSSSMHEWTVPMALLSDTSCTVVTLACFLKSLVVQDQVTNGKQNSQQKLVVKAKILTFKLKSR